MKKTPFSMHSTFIIPRSALCFSFSVCVSHQIVINYGIVSVLRTRELLLFLCWNSSLNSINYNDIFHFKLQFLYGYAFSVIILLILCVCACGFIYISKAEDILFLSLLQICLIQFSPQQKNKLRTASLMHNVQFEMIAMNMCKLIVLHFEVVVVVVVAAISLLRNYAVQLNHRWVWCSVCVCSVYHTKRCHLFFTRY